MVFLVGPTGSGKSTIMRLLIKELEPTDGRIRVAGRDLADIERKKVPYYRRNVGVVFQDFKLLPTRTVYDNIAYALQVTGASRKQIRATLPDILRLTGLSTKLHNYPHQLSGGEQQRVAVARAFASHPPLLLADEPTGNLDPETSIGIMQLLYRINRAGTTVIVASHDNEMVDRMRRRVIELKRGRIVRDEASGLYGAREENTDELGERLKRRTSREAGVLPQRGVSLDAAQRRAELRGARVGARHDARARRVHPGRQATNGAANDVRGRVLVDVDMTTERERRRSRARARRAANARRTSRASNSSPSSRATNSEQKVNPQAFALIGYNPLPDIFRVTPDHPEDSRRAARRARPVQPAGHAPGDRPGDRRRAEPPGADGHDPVGHARDQDHDGAARGAAGDRVDPADLEHDPPLAVLAPARGRGDEARRRHRLVHPLAVRARGAVPRRARRRRARSACWRSRRSRSSIRWRTP